MVTKDLSQTALDEWCGGALKIVFKGISPGAEGERRIVMEVAKIGTLPFVALGLGAILAFLLPLGIAVLWKVRKKERFTTILIGASTFLLFAIILEKPIQNVLIFPGQMGLADHAISRFIQERPVLWAFVLALFPGVFEETGRLAAFKTVLRERKNRETAISYGIGHGGIEVMMTLGLTYTTYIVYAVMMNRGTFQIAIDQVAKQAPDQVDALYGLADQLANLTVADIGMGFAERVFGVLFHIGASILVFYACRDRGKRWLYPLAILLHTAMDFVAALAAAKVFAPSVLVLEGIIGAFGILTFCGAYFLLYQKEREKGVYLS